ncbi:hypothetical protein P7C70_g2779, partial [Phenoliferia sp. Uapishka_3]
MNPTAATDSNPLSHSRDSSKPRPNGMLAAQPTLSSPLPASATNLAESTRGGGRSATRRKLSLGLGSILKGKRGESSGSGGSDDLDAAATSSPIPVTTPQPLHPRSISVSVNQPSLTAFRDTQLAIRSTHQLDCSETANNSSSSIPNPVISTTTISPSALLPNSHLVSSTSPRKPPVSLPTFFRRRRSSSAAPAEPDAASQTPGMQRTVSHERMTIFASRTIFNRRSSNSNPNSVSTPSAETSPGYSHAGHQTDQGVVETQRIPVGMEGRPPAAERGASDGTTGTSGSGGTGRESDESRTTGDILSSEESRSGTASDEEEVEVSDFATQGSPFSVPSSTFSSVSIHREREPSVTSSTLAPSYLSESITLPEGSPRVSSPTPSTSSSGHLYLRSQTRNIDNLQLANFPRTSPPLPSRVSIDHPRSSPLAANTTPTASNAITEAENCPPATHFPSLLADSTTSSPVLPDVDALSDLPTVIPSTVETDLTARRMRALPRLLSSSGYSFSSPRAYSGSGAASPESEGDGETETETETETDTEDAGDSDEGDTTFTSADEGASSHTSHPASPVAGPSSQRSPTTPRLGYGLSSSIPSPRLQSFSPLPPGNSWVTFNPFTPTPGPLPTTRPSGDDTPSASYFDLPRNQPTSGGKTPRLSAGGPLMSPLLPMSMGSAARGKRPTWQDEAQQAPPPNVNSTTSTSVAAESEVLGQDSQRRRRHSAVNMLSPRLGSSDGEQVGTAALEGLDPIWRTGLPGSQATSGLAFLSPGLVAPLATPAGDWTKPPPTPAMPVLTRTLTSATSATNRLHRPRSMYELHVAPPAYHSVYIRPGLQAGQLVFPREEEGKEPLPDYTCAVHFEAYMPRKMEFTAPTVQAKDRAWKKQYVVLHGTAIKIYKYDLRTHPIAGEEDWSTVSTEMTGTGGPPAPHFHVGEYGVVADPAGKSSKFASSIVDARIIAKSRITAAAPNQGNQLLRHYSLQNAESGLAADYIKRKHAVRVRAEGEQFLLQAKDDRGVIDLIEALQAATNVALDLDTRLPPKFITLPRRRRRRRVPPPQGDEAAQIAQAVAASTAEGQVNPRSDDSRLGAMLDEEQTAYASRSGATVM